MSDYSSKSSAVFLSLAVSVFLSVVFVFADFHLSEARAAFAWKFLIVDVLFFGSAFVFWISEIYLANLSRRDGLAVRYASHGNRLLLLAIPLVSVFATPRILREIRSMADYPASSKVSWFWFAKILLTGFMFIVDGSAITRGDFLPIFLTDLSLSVLWAWYFFSVDAGVSSRLGISPAFDRTTFRARQYFGSLAAGIQTDDAHLRKYYGMAFAELVEGTSDRDIWAKAMVDSGGNPDKTKSLYLKYRARELFEESLSGGKTP